MRLYKFRTKYGLRVIGGDRFGDIIRTPSTREELELHVDEVVPSIVARAEMEHERALEQQRKSWNM